MFASVRKVSKWFGALLRGGSAESTPPAISAQPKPQPAASKSARRKSAPRPSPMAQARPSPVKTKQPRRTGAHAERPKAVPPRPKTVATTPKRTPKPRHVWLSDAAPPSAARSADIITLRPEPAARPTSTDQAKTLLARLLATQIAAAA